MQSRRTLPVLTSSCINAYLDASEAVQRLVTAGPIGSTGYCDGACCSDQCITEDAGGYFCCAIPLVPSARLSMRLTAM